MSLLDRIIAHGNRTLDVRQIRSIDMANVVKCKDGFSLSVIAGPGTYCRPRPDMEGPANFAGPYTAVEVGFPSARPEPWERWVEHCEDPEDPTGAVYGRVPVELVRELVAAHGGEVTQ